MRFCQFTGKTLVIAVVLAGTLPVLAEDQSAEKPDHWVAAMYFHRTKRCPTCQTISAYIEAATKTGFAEEMKQGTVGFCLIDFQDEKNKSYSDAYRISGPTLIIAGVRGGKVSRWKAMPKVWSLVTKKEDFFKYVQEGIADYLEAE